MRAHYFQHVPFEGLGSIEPWLRNAGYRITVTRLFESAKFPNLREIDFLIIMGGPMSVHDENIIPWLFAEKQFIREAIDTDKPILGICLGAQLIASVLGAEVHQNSMKEIGWFPIYGIALNDNSFFEFPPSLKVFHWHGETFDLPLETVCLAKSDVCENQAFQLGHSVIGLQFHLETTPQTAAEIITNCREELITSKYVQTEQEILSVPSENYCSINRQMDKILSFLTSR